MVKVQHENVQYDLKPEDVDGIKEDSPLAFEAFGVEDCPREKSSKLQPHVLEVSSDSAAALLYGVTDKPPWHLSILLGLQHFLLFFGGTVSLPLLLAPKLCISPTDSSTPFLISTVFFVCGLNSLLQITFGVRLPIIQGTTFAFLGPTFSILELPQWQCPNTSTIESMDYDDRQELWHTRIRELQGAIIVSSVFEVLLGFTGAIGIFVRFIGPLTIAPTIALTGLSLFGTAAFWAGKHWGITVLVIILMTFFSQYAPRMQWTFLSKMWANRIKALCQLFPVIMAVLIAWGVCGIVTASGGFTDDPRGYGYTARTDVKGETLSRTPWIRFPYPFQWGLPTFSISGFSVLAGVFAGIIESIGDYYACARISGVPPPPVHAINRGIGMEGIGCILAGIWGTGSGTTSYSGIVGVTFMYLVNLNLLLRTENIAALGITKVGSRRVVLCTSVSVMIIGIFSKFGGLMATMPDPIVGGLYCGIFGMVSAVGLSALHNVDLNCTRNLFVLGFSLFMGMTVPSWVKDHREIFSNMTGVPQINQITEVLLSTHMFIGGLLACFLDNTIPGSLKSRGMVPPEQDCSWKESATMDEIYGLPFGISGILERYKCFRFFPFLPHRSQTKLPMDGI